MISTFFIVRLSINKSTISSAAFLPILPILKSVFFNSFSCTHFEINVDIAGNNSTEMHCITLNHDNDSEWSKTAAKLSGHATASGMVMCFVAQQSMWLPHRKPNFQVNSTTSPDLCNVQGSRHQCIKQDDVRADTKS